VFFFTESGPFHNLTFVFVFSKRRECARIYGDPHITSFDNLEWDCSGHGEFILSKSTSDDFPFEVRGRFWGPESYHPWTATKSVAFKVNPDVPTIEVHSIDTGEDGCALEVQIGGETIVNPVEYFKDSPYVNTRSGTHGIVYMFAGYDTDVQVSNRRSKWQEFGCQMKIDVCVDPDKNGGYGSIIGALGTPTNTKSDEWTDKNGVAHPIDWSNSQFGKPNQETSRKFCIDNWCIREKSESMFTDEDPDMFDTYNQCDTPFDLSDLPIEDEPIPRAIEEACTKENGEIDHDCVIDGKAGGLDAALNTLEDKEEGIPEEDPDADSLAMVDIIKTVLHGHHDCTRSARKKEYGLSDTPITYCYKVINNGAVPLTGVTVNDDGFTRSVGTLELGEFKFVSQPTTITRHERTAAKVTTDQKVDDTDTARVVLVIPPTPKGCPK